MLYACSTCGCSRCRIISCTHELCDDYHQQNKPAPAAPLSAAPRQSAHLTALRRRLQLRRYWDPPPQATGHLHRMHSSQPWCIVIRAE